MTVADWYRLCVTNGRAPVDADWYRLCVTNGRAPVDGFSDEPYCWVTQPRRDREIYAVCWSQRDKLELVPGTCSMEAVKLL